MRNKKVLFVAHVDSHIQAFHISFLKMFKEQGYEVHVASHGNIIFDNCDAKFDIPFARNPLNLSNISAYFKLKKILNENQYDIIHCHTPVGGLITRIANKNCNYYSSTRIIYTAHGFHFFKGNNPAKNFLFRNIEKYAAKYTDTLITINKEDYEAAKKFKLKKNGTVEYIPGVGIDIKKIKAIQGNKDRILEELHLKNDTILLLSVGELNKNKNHKVVIEALPSLPNNFHYLICGQGHLDQYLRDLSKKLKVEERLHLLGYRNNIVEIMKSCDVFIFPSIREGLSVALMEAMASGLLCIVSDVRGNRDLIDQLDGGFIVNLDSLQQQIPYILLNQADLFNKMINYNLKKIKKYNVDEIMKQMKSIYGLEL